MEPKRVISLSRDGHDYVFTYEAGLEGQVVEEIMRLADDSDARLNWEDAAKLGLQITQYVAEDCCTAIMAPIEQPPPSRQRRAQEDDPDDARDGPCSNNFL